MAGSNTVSITFKLDGDAKGFKDLAKDAEGLKKVLQGTVSQADHLHASLINFAALASGLSAASRAFGQLEGSMKTLTDAYAVQEAAETKLATVMAQRMNATEEEIASIRRLASEQQKLGVIGDEVQLSGAQQVATFLTEKSSLDTLIPAMNNLIAQQKGYNATTQDAVSVANLMGKAMQGQTSALTRVGITFSDAEAKVLKYGTESERAAMLAQVITNNVGQMNTELAKTDSGKQAQLANAIGDIKERLGSLMTGAMPFVTMAAQTAQALAGVTTLIGGFRTLTNTIKAYNTAAKVMKAVTGSMSAASSRAAAVIRVFSRAAQEGTSRTIALRIAIKSLATATAATAAVTALVTIITRLTRASKEAAAQQKELADSLAESRREMRDLGDLTAQNSQDEIAALDRLYGVASDEAAAQRERTEALREMQAQYPSYFSSLSAEALNLDTLKEGYDKLRSSIIETAKARAAESKIQENTGALIDVEMAIKDKQAELDALTARAESARAAMESAQGAARAEGNDMGWFARASMGAEVITPATESGEAARAATQNYASLTDEIAKANEEMAALTARQGDLNAANAELAKIAAGQGSVSSSTQTAATATAAATDTIADAVEDYYRSIQRAIDINDTFNGGQGETLLILNTMRSGITALISKYGVENAEVQKLIDEYKELRDAQSKLMGLEEVTAPSARAASSGSGSSSSSSESSSGDSTDGLPPLDRIRETEKGIRSLSSAFGSLGEAIGGNAETIMDWLGKVVESIGQAISVFVQLAQAQAMRTALTEADTAATATNAATAAAASATVTAAKNQEATANAAAAATGAGASVASIPWVGAAMAVAAIAAVIAALANMPKFASGGIISGPTVGLMGEYAGAGNNPEVVAPLSKLRGMLADTGGTGGKVEFRIEGRTLTGVLKKETRHTTRR